MTRRRAVRIKVCCIATADEAQLAIEAGASAVGLVSAMPSGPGVISEAAIETIARATPPPIGTFLLTSHQSVPDIVKQQRRCRTNTLQLCDTLVEGSYAELRDALPGISIVQVIHVHGPGSIDAALALEAQVDALLLDSGNASLAVKQLGGTGRTHDWDVSAKLTSAVKIPVFLAGGLHAGNVRAAIDQVRPWGIDVCTGVRTDSRLDLAKLATFVAACTAET